MTDVLPARNSLDLQYGFGGCVIAQCDTDSESVCVNLVADISLELTATNVNMVVGKDVVYPFVRWVSVLATWSNWYTR